MKPVLMRPVLLGYQVDRGQLMDAMSLFKQFDTDHDGVIKVGEFPALWHYLGFRSLAADSGPPPTVALSFAKSWGFLAGKSVDNSYQGPNSPRNSSRSQTGADRARERKHAAQVAQQLAAA
jgi:hypothetical protein